MTHLTPSGRAHYTGSVPEPVTPASLDRALLGEERLLTARELVAEAGVTEAFAREYWRALGFPLPDDDAPVFTRSDARAVAELSEVARREGFDEATVTTLVRSVGHTMDRLALWQVEALVDHTVRAEQLDDAEARRTVLRHLGDLAPVLESQLVHAWRRHAASLAGRYAVEFATDGHAEAELDDAGSGRALPLPRAVGFADIVAFTKRTAGLGSAELASFVQDFETRARDVITGAGGRVVKTIGDAVLFVADDVATGADVALGLAAAGAGADPSGGAGPAPVRVSLAWGRVLSRFGDIFGPVVNLASRLSEQADPGSVLVDPATARELARHDRFALTQLAPVELQGFGLVRPVRLTPAFRPEGA